MIELGISPPARRVVRHSYTSQITSAVEQWAEHGLYGAMVGALEASARAYAAAFAVARVQPVNSRTRVRTPSVLASIARRMITSGETVLTISVDSGMVRLTECSSWNVGVGGPDEASWRYQCTTTGPAQSVTAWHPSEAVVHPRYAVSHLQPWQGIGPLTLAGTTGRLAAELERVLRDESSGPVGSVIPLPVDAGGEQEQGEQGEADADADPFAALKRQIANLRGRCGLVETTAAGYGHGPAAAPRDDWRPRRVGPAPPDALVTLRETVETTITAVCGLPVDLLRSGGADRESFRRFLHLSVQPLGALVAEECSRKLDVPGLRLDFGAIAAADVHGRSRAFRSLVRQEHKMDPERAARIVGI